jgi:cell division protein FtsQ
MQDNRNGSEQRIYRTPAVRHRKKRKTMNLYATLGVSIVAAIGSLLSVNVFFRLNLADVTVSGTELYTADQIEYVGGIVEGQNLIRLNTEFIEARLKKNLVYVDDVSVTKELPNKLTVTITEATKQAQIQNGDLYCTISESGRVLENAALERDTSLPLIVGYELKDNTPGVDAESTDSQKTKILTDIMSELSSISFDKITEIDLTDRTDIKLDYDNRIEIILGSSVDMDIKLSYIKTVIDTGLPESYEGTLRYNGIDSGISAIPKQTKITVSADSSSADSDTDSQSQSEDAYAADSQTDYSYDGYSDYSDYSDYSGDTYGSYDGYGDTYTYDTYDTYGSDYGYSTDGTYTSTW